MTPSTIMSFPVTIDIDLMAVKMAYHYGDIEQKLEYEKKLHELINGKENS